MRGDSELKTRFLCTRKPEKSRLQRGGVYSFVSLLQNTPEEDKDAQANIGNGSRVSFYDGCPGSERGQGVERMVVLESNTAGPAEYAIQRVRIREVDVADCYRRERGF